VYDVGHDCEAVGHRCEDCPSLESLLSIDEALAASTVLPAGDYIIIDPCYVYGGARWQGLVDVIYGCGADTGVFTDPVTGCRFAYSGTFAGDGVYLDHAGHLYGVDSGGLACLPLAMVDAATLAMLPARDHSREQCCSGRLVTFDTAWRCIPCDARGVIQFGSVVITTGPGWDTDEAAEA
jgi:hypothetical protein